MAYFEVKKRFFDSQNFLEFLPGQIVETEEMSWVSRIGSRFLSSINLLKKGQIPILVKNTLDEKHAVELLKAKEEFKETLIEEDLKNKEVIPSPEIKVQRRSRVKIINPDINDNSKVADK